MPSNGKWDLIRRLKVKGNEKRGAVSSVQFGRGEQRAFGRTQLGQEGDY